MYSTQEQRKRVNKLINVLVGKRLSCNQNLKEPRVEKLFRSHSIFYSSVTDRPALSQKKG